MNFISKCDGEFWTTLKNHLLSIIETDQYDAIVIALFKDELYLEYTPAVVEHYKFDEFRWDHVIPSEIGKQVIYKNDRQGDPVDRTIKASDRQYWISYIPDILDCEYSIPIGDFIDITNNPPSTIDEAIRTLQSLPEKKKMNDFWISDLRILYEK